MPLPRISLNPVLKTINILSVLILLVFNLSLIIPDEIRPKTPFYSLYNGTHTTSLIPSQVFWLIWPLSLVFLVCFALYQWIVSEGQEEAAIEQGVFIWLAVTVIFQGTWLTLWISDHLFIAWIMLLLAFVAITRVYVVLRRRFRHLDNAVAQFFLHVPFSVYHAFITCLLVINTFVVLVPGKSGVTYEPGVWGEVFAIMGELVLLLSAIAYVEGGRDDFAAALVIAWFLLNVYVDYVPNVILTPRVRWIAFISSLLTLAHAARGPFTLRAPRPVRWIEHASPEEREHLRESLYRDEP